MAVIHSGNVASQRAFRRVGFERDRGVWHDVFGLWTMTYAAVAGGLCALCRAGAPHHTNAAGSIGGDDRHAILDVHAVEDASGVGLRECDAGDLLLAWAKARSEMGAGRARRAVDVGRGGSTPPASTNTI